MASPADNWKRKREKSRHLEVHLVHHCNLNCAGCSHFSPSADTWFADIGSYKKDIERLKEIKFLDKFTYIHLMGGEPLLNKNYNEFISETRKTYKGPIKLSTNGILLPVNDKQEEKKKFWQTAKKAGILIHLSWYPPLKEEAVKNIKKMAKKHGVKLKVKEKPKMRGPGFKLNAPYDAEKNFSQCPVSVCTNLVAGNLYTCAPLAYAFIFNKKFKQNLPTTGAVDIYAHDDAKELLQQLNQPVDLCSYCVVTKDQYKKRVKWYQSGGKMEEYVREEPIELKKKERKPLNKK